MASLNLTPKQESFCQLYIELGNASEAYRQSYDADSMNENTVNRKAKELLDNGKITARLEELRAPIVEKAQLPLETHLVELDPLKTVAEGAGNITAAMRAEDMPVPIIGGKPMSTTEALEDWVRCRCQAST